MIIIISFEAIKKSIIYKKYYLSLDSYFDIFNFSNTDYC